MKLKLLFLAVLILVLAPVSYAVVKYAREKPGLDLLNAKVGALRGQYLPASIYSRQIRLPIACPGAPEGLGIFSGDVTNLVASKGLYQFLLNYFGLETGAPTSYKTKDLLKAFQKEQGINQSGKIDEATRQKISGMCQLPVITGIIPESGRVGEAVTLTGSGLFNSEKVNFGEISVPAVSQNKGTGVVFTVPDKYKHCLFSKGSIAVYDKTSMTPNKSAGGESCGTLLRTIDVTPGNYKVSVTVNGNISNPVNFTVAQGQAQQQEIPQIQNEESNSSAGESIDCGKITDEQTCLNNKKPLCNFLESKCVYPTCATLAKRINKEDLNTYSIGCFSDKVPDGSWNYAGKTSDCGSSGNLMTATLAPKSGCFWKERLK
ncbi:MAG: hypothetical protein CEN90_597 [Parcubacteria group bacterium Licking1014_17]|nr:MAG: hypothetical protein CEN90_597 [Parcubacteria group bacterium Licking1014_17]